MNTLHRFLVAGLLTGLSLIDASSAWADQRYQGQQYQQPQPRERSYGSKIGKKALDGVINLPTAPLELPKAIINDVNANGSNIVFGVIGGVLEGTLQTAYRATAGLVDLTTFLIPTKPIVQPQYVWDDFYEESSSYGKVFRLDNNGEQPHFELPGQAASQGITRQSSKPPSTMY